MKKLIYISLIGLFFINCKKKSEIQTIGSKPKEVELSIAQKIANAHGFEHWKNVMEIAFAFGERRHWLWKPKTNEVSLFRESDTITYNRKQVDSIVAKTDAAFVNDKFWLLIPFQLVWDKRAAISEPTTTEAPISKTQLNKITITYSNDGGYTPGDAYDIYYDNNYCIKEWTYRRGNQEEPSLTNTFENYQDFNGIKIALEHKNAKGDWNLKFTDVKVTLE